MRTATEATWRKRVDGWIASGQTCKEYAAHIRVNPHTLGWWKWRLHAAQADARSQGDACFVEVTQEVAASMTNAGGVLELEVGRAVIRIHGHVEADMLGRAHRAGGATMIPVSVRIFVCTEPQDMRRGFDALALTVRQVIGEDPRGGALFVFASRRFDRVKVLWWDRNGWYRAASTVRYPRRPRCRSRNGWSCRSSARPRRPRAARRHDRPSLARPLAREPPRGALRPRRSAAGALDDRRAGAPRPLPLLAGSRQRGRG